MSQSQHDKNTADVNTMWAFINEEMKRLQNKRPATVSHLQLLYYLRGVMLILNRADRELEEARA